MTRVARKYLKYLHVVTRLTYQKVEAESGAQRWRGGGHACLGMDG
jgi:hypothetical protein